MGVYGNLLNGGGGGGRKEERHKLFWRIKAITASSIEEEQRKHAYCIGAPQRAPLVAQTVRF